MEYKPRRRCWALEAKFLKDDLHLAAKWTLFLDWGVAHLDEFGRRQSRFADPRRQLQGFEATNVMHLL